MVLDGVIKRNSPPIDVRKMLIRGIQLFATAFPNWQDAYHYANEYLINSATVAEDRIEAMLR